jgi:hypothetical protein
MKLGAKLNPNVTQGTRKKEDKFEFNNDASKNVCKAGHMAIQKASQGRKGMGKNRSYTYYFARSDGDICRQSKTNNEINGLK